MVVRIPGKCERCGRLRRRWLSRIPYADFPPRKFATTRMLRKVQLGTLDVRTCPQCVWAHSKTETIAGVCLIFVLLILFGLSQPDFPRAGWPLTVGGTAMVLLIVVLL